MISSSTIGILNVCIILAVFVVNMILAWILTCKIVARTNPYLKEAFAMQLISRDEKKSKMFIFNGKIVKDSNLTCLIIGVITGALTILTGRGLLTALLTGSVIAGMPRILSSMQKSKLQKKLGYNMYRIYRYLSNQISSGVKPVDAMKTVYNVPEEPELKACLIDVSARLELTNDIEESFKIFRDKFHSMETESLFLTLKQGIQTGNTGDLLEKQEEYHFLKYLSKIQAETENSGYKAFAAALAFSLVVCILFIIPLLMEVGNAIASLSGQ